MTAAPTVAALFVRADSIYKTMPGVDAWDIERDARAWPGGCPVVAHPPCRSWSSLSHMAKPRIDERALAPWAITQARQWGGVVEHPKSSKLWRELNLPEPGAGVDEFGGWSMGISQRWWGHSVEKPTKLYVVGVHPRDIPQIPLSFAPVTRRMCHRTDGLRKGDMGFLSRLDTKAREHTPPALAEWLVDLARRCRVREEIAA